MKGALDRAGISFEYEAFHGGGGGHSALPPITIELLDPPSDLMLIRYGQLRFPTHVPLRRRVELSVAINLEARAAEAGQVELGLTARDWPLLVTASLVGVNPADFKIVDHDTATIEVPRAADSKPVTFTLVPQSLGPKMVRVRFEQNRAYLGTAFIHAEVLQSTAQFDECDAYVEYPPVLDALVSPRRSRSTSKG